MDSRLDYSLFKSLWSRINDAVVRPPFPGDPARECLLMEMPGYSINPDSFDVEKFRESPTAMSPACATAMLVDRVPAFAHHFYDTGSHISFYWKQLVETFAIIDNPGDDPALKAKYDTAIEMLYGGPSGYKSLQKTELFERLDTLRAEWQKAIVKLEEFRNSCRKRQGWPENFESGVRPYRDKIEDAFTEYDNLRSQIEQYQAAIFQYTRGDLSILLLQQRQVMGQRALYNAGTSGAAAPFYQTILEPNDWWKWFRDDEPFVDEGWTHIEVKQGDVYESQSDTWSQLATNIDTHFRGLFSVGESGRSIHSKKHNALTSRNSNLTFSFKIHKVAIGRPWMDVGLFQYTTIGIRGLRAGSWSTGELDSGKNDGTFPLLPTHFLVAKDIEICAHKDDERLAGIFRSAGGTADDKLNSRGNVMGIGCFTVKGNFNSHDHSHHSVSEFNPDTNTLKVKGAHIIGWVCSVVPRFPAVSMVPKSQLGGMLPLPVPRPRMQAGPQRLGGSGLSSTGQYTNGPSHKDDCCSGCGGGRGVSHAAAVQCPHCQKSMCVMCKQPWGQLQKDTVNEGSLDIPSQLHHGPQRHYVDIPSSVREQLVPPPRAAVHGERQFGAGWGWPYPNNAHQQQPMLQPPPRQQERQVGGFPSPYSAHQQPMRAPEPRAAVNEERQVGARWGWPPPNSANQRPVLPPRPAVNEERQLGARWGWQSPNSAHQQPMRTPDPRPAVNEERQVHVGARWGCPSPISARQQPVAPPRPAVNEERQQVGWTCPQCTFLNRPRRPGCELCGEERPRDYVIPEDYPVEEFERKGLENERMFHEYITVIEKARKEKEAQENYRKLVEAEESNLTTNKEAFDCVICFDDVQPGEGVILKGCLHEICKECLHYTVVNSEEAETKCPACDAVISERDIRAVCSEEEVQTIVRKRGLVQAESASGNPENLERARWIEANEKFIESKTKPCPRCKVPTVKEGGCMHVTCTSAPCKFEWCWICEVAWNRNCQSTHWFG